MKFLSYLSLFVSSSVFVMPKNEEEWRLFFLTWITFVVLVVFGALPRIVLNKEKSDERITLYQVFKVFVIAFFVCFIAKEVLKVSDNEAHEIWALPLIAFSSELILASYGKNVESIITAIWDRLKKFINEK